MGGGLTSCYDDSKIWREIEVLSKTVDELQSELESEVDALKSLIDALKENVYVTNVTEIKEGDTVTGYTINLSKGQAITIYHGKNGANGTNGKDGQDGTTPTISAVLEDGVYYWAVNGEILEVNGKKMPVYEESDVPEFKYENGIWYISIGEGEWSPLASTGEDNSECTFEDVTYDDASITFTLAGGTEITLPRTAVFSLNIAESQIAILPGATVKVAYTITGATESTSIYAVADGGYSAKVEAAGISEGVVSVTAPDPLTDGKVVVLAGDDTKAAMQVLSFEEGVLTLVSETYSIGKEGGQIEIPVTTNLDYEISVPEDAAWITYAETKTVREETIVLNVAENTEEERSATVSLLVEGAVIQTISITQETAAEAKFTLDDILGKWTVSYGTVGSTYEWVFTASDDESKGNVRLDNIFGKSKKPVYATFNLYTGVLTIPLRQECTDDFGFIAYLCTTENTESVSYTIYEDETFGNPTATIAYAWYENSEAYKSLTNVSGVKVDPNVLAVGSYYYSDGTHSGLYDSSKTLIGIVAWLGDITATDPTLKAAFPECTNGLVVSVTGIETVWQSVPASIGAWQETSLTGYSSIVAELRSFGTNLDNCLGYNNTQVIKAYNEANPDNKVEAYEKMADFASGNPAPEGTSGWYIPSAKEQTYFIYGENSNAFNAYSYTNALNFINEKVTAAGLPKIAANIYASSTEQNESNIISWQSTGLNTVSKTSIYYLYPVFAF